MRLIVVNTDEKQRETEASFKHNTVTSKGNLHSTVLIQENNDAAEIYVDRILPLGSCSHFKKHQGFSETVRNERDEKELAKINQIDMDSRAL